MGKRGKRVKGTQKEKEIVGLLREGYGVSYVASHFGISESEVRKIRREARKAQEQFPGKPSEGVSRPLLPLDLEKHQESFFEYLFLTADSCSIPLVPFFCAADWEKGQLKFFHGDCTSGGEDCGRRACATRLVVLRWEKEPDIELIVEPAGYEEEHAAGTQFGNVLSEFKRLAARYIGNAPAVLAYLEDQAREQHPELRAEPKRFQWAKVDDRTAKRYSEDAFELWMRLAGLGKQLRSIARRWISDPLTMPRTECSLCASYGGLGYW